MRRARALCGANVLTLAFVLFGCAALTLRVAAGASKPASLPPEPSQADIRRVVEELGHPIPSRRQAARRQLVRWGARVAGELRRAAQEQNLEASLEARDLLEELDSAFFHGGQVGLEVNRTAVDWDEPFDVTVVVHNPTRGPIRVTWAAPATAPAGRRASEAVSQVEAMFDVADFLQVRDPRGQEVDLRTDPIDRDPGVKAAVEQRARNSPSGHLVEPGETARLRIAEFNRGWARFPMLEQGKYRISVWYQPPWRDEKWVKEGLGLTASPPIEVEVRRGAPQAILDANRPLRLLLTRSGDDLVVELHNLWDRPQWVNLDMGVDPETQALLTWRVFQADRADAEPVALSPRMVLPERADRMPRLAPNEKIELARTTVSDLWKSLRAAGGGHPGWFEVTARYQFLGNVEGLRAAMAARKRQVDVPAGLFSGSPTSNEIRIRLPAESNPAK